MSDIRLNGITYPSARKVAFPGADGREVVFDLPEDAEAVLNGVSTKPPQTKAVYAAVQDLRQRQTTPFNFKGSVASASALPSSGNEINDTYYLEDVKYRVTYTGDAEEPWQQSSMDESDYEDELGMLQRSSEWMTRQMGAKGMAIRIDTAAETEPGVYASSTGEKASAQGDYLRTKGMYPVTPWSFVLCDQYQGKDSAWRPKYCFYAADKTYISSVNAQNPDSYNFSLIPSLVPAGAAYMALYAAEDGFPEELTIRCVSGDGNARNIDKDYAGSGTSYVVIRGARISTIPGIVSNPDESDVVLIPNPNASQIFTSYINYGTETRTPMLCAALYDGYPVGAEGSAEILTPSYVESVNGNGHGSSQVACLYDIPEGTRGILLAIPKTFQVNADGESVSYANILRADDRPLAMEKILCIGDSITWLDGNAYDGSGDTGRMVGYQRQLRYAGAIVDTKGYNGLPLAKSDERYSAYSGIVEEGVDVSGYDKIIIFLGGNDVIYNIPIGDIPEQYKAPSFDAYSMCGAFGALVWYIRTHNPDCKIYTVILGKSQDGARSFARFINYRDALMRCGLFWSTPVIDLFTLDNLTPWATDQEDPDGTTMTQFRHYHYDGTHYNYKGRMRIGAIIRDHIARDYGASIPATNVNISSSMTIDEGAEWSV